MFLAGDWQSTASGTASGFALVFAMNDLFEAFIGRSVRRAVAPWQVHLQQPRHYAIEAPDGPLFRLKPDIVVETPDGPMVLDTKWKRLDPGEKTMNIDSPDIYQMHAYAHAYDAARLILVYPWRQEVIAQPGIARHWRIYGTRRILDVATVDVGCPEGVVESLRQIVGGTPLDRRPAEALSAAAVPLS